VKGENEEERRQKVRERNETKREVEIGDG